MRALVLGVVLVAAVGWLPQFAKRARAEEPITLQVSGSAAGGFATRTSEADRPRDAADSAALFEGMPGLRVRRLAGSGSFATLTIRGAASNQIAVSLAGVPLNGAADPSFDFATLPLWPGASARVHRTFAPASLGGGYLGGLVEIQPIDATLSATRPRTEAYQAIGSFGALRMRMADARALGGGWRVASGLSASRSEGDFLYWDPGLSANVRRRNDDSRQVAAIVQARRDGDDWDILLTSLASARRDGVAGPFDLPTMATRLARDRELLAFEARRRDASGRFLLRAWSRREGRTFDDPLGEQGSAPGSANDRVLAAGATLGRSLRAGDFSLDARLDEAIETSSGSRVVSRRDRFRLGGSLDVTWKASRSLTLVAAGRADVVEDRGPDDSGRDLLPAAHLGAEATLSPNVTLAAHAGMLSRPPSFLELLGDGGAYTPSPGLRSERALAADVGLRAFCGSNPRLDVELVGFASSVRNLIVVLPEGFRTLRAKNIGDALLLGAEASLALSAGPLRALASYTRLATEDRTADASTRGAPLPGRPGHDLTLELSVAIGPAVLRYGFDIVAGTTLDRAGTRELPTRVFHGIGARIALGSAQVLAQIDDLFDRRTVEVISESGSAPRTTRYPVSDFLGYPLPGRRFTLAVRWAL